MLRTKNLTHPNTPLHAYLLEKITRIEGGLESPFGLGDVLSEGRYPDRHDRNDCLVTSGK